MSLEYIDIVLVKEKTRLDKEAAFLNSGSEEPLFEGISDPGDYEHYTRSKWESPLVTDAFSNSDYANMPQLVVRRDTIDDLLCVERSMSVFGQIRAHYYELEKKEVEQDSIKVDFEIANYTNDIDGAFKNIDKL